MYQLIIENEYKANIIFPKGFISYMDHGINGHTEKAIMHLFIYSFSIPLLSTYCMSGFVLLLYNLQIFTEVLLIFLIKKKY